MLKAAIFDLDGTLIDSMGVWQEVDRIWMARHHIVHTPELDYRFKTLPFDASAQYVVDTYHLPVTAQEVIDEWRALAQYEYEHTVTAKGGVDQFLSFLQARRIVMAVATSCLKEPCLGVLAHTGLDRFFQHILFTADFHTTKQEAALYLACAERLGVKPSECVVFEDILPALLGAKKAGMKTVAVYDAATSEPWQETVRAADGHIVSWTEAEKVWDTLEQGTD